jgi:hypothetical protein
MVMLGDKTGHNHLVGKSGIDRVALPFEGVHNVFEPASQKYASSDYCDGIHNGLGGIKRKYFPSRVHDYSRKRDNS